MKLVGNVEVCNRLLPSLNISAKGRTHRSSLSIAKQPGTESDLFILYQSNQNKLGTKYKIKNNIEQVFTKFVKEGKSTIRFINPPHDIRINSDALQLKSFLKVLKLCLENKKLPKHLPLSSSTPSTQAITKPKTKLVILSRSDYPVLSGFPRTLEELQILNIKQEKFDKSILKLHYLKVLILSNNLLTSLPEELGLLHCLTILTLDNNILGKGPSNWSWLNSTKLASSLRSLDLSHNKIAILPQQVVKLKSVVSLKLDHNGLLKLPHGLGTMSQLRYLSASHNSISTLPGSITLLHLDSIDLSENKFDGMKCALTTFYEVPSLLEWAGITIIKNRLYYSAESISQQLEHYLDNAYYCRCGSACFKPFASGVVDTYLNTIAASVTCSENATSPFPLEAHFCSQKCLRNYYRYSAQIQVA